MHPIIIQAIYYGILMCFTIGGVGLLLSGFFWKYVKVRISFGKYLLVKVRSSLRDYFVVGHVDEGFLVYTYNKSEKRIKLDNADKCVYRALAVNWIDINEGTNALSTTEYSAVSGFDAIKYSDLYTRALMRPNINSNQDKLIVALLIGIGLVCIGCLYLTYMNAQGISEIMPGIQGTLSSLKGTISTGGI